MKNQKNTYAAKKAREERERRLQKLIQACLERFSEDEMIEAFNAETGKEYALELDEDEMIDKLNEFNQYCIFRVETFQQESQLREFAESVVYPNYNVQQYSILF